MKRAAFVLVLVIGLLLSWAVQDFPSWGDPHAPASSSPVSSHFIANTGVDTEVPNMVTAVLADYRGFDTMFETVVCIYCRIGGGFYSSRRVQHGERDRGCRRF